MLTSFSQYLMEPWVLITIAAAFVQNIRSSLQKQLKGVMGTSGATFVRFAFGLPVAAVLLALVVVESGGAVPSAGAAFWVWVSLAVFAQIIAQALLIYLFGFRNFAVGTAYSRTEPVLAALFGLIFLGDALPPGALIAIAISVIGVMFLSLARSPVHVSAMLGSIFTQTTAIGLLSGAFFGIAAVGYRGASLSLDTPSFLIAAGFTLLIAITLQTVLVACWIAMREPAQFAAIAAAWKPSALVGLAGALASFGWFSAFTLQNAALVKTVAQVEMLFTLATGWWFFSERINAREMIGVMLIVAGIVGLFVLR